MANPYMFPPILACCIVFMVYNLYWIAHFCHPMDSFFGSSAATKGLLVSFECSSSRAVRVCSN